MESLELLKAAAKALDSKKAQEISALYVEDVTTLADYFLLATGSSSTQVRALADEVDYALSQLGVEPNHVERSTTWTLLDYGSLVVHVFYKDARDFYALDKMWQDAKTVDLSEILTD
jgi:ribosome-associated protein